MALQTKDAGGVIQNLPLYIDPAFSVAEGSITAVTSATDQVVLVGVAGTVARLKHVDIMLTPIATGTAGLFQRVDLVRRSTALSGQGATVNVTTSTSLAKHLPTSAAPACTVNRFTGTAPTVGTLAGTFRSTFICQVQMGSTTVAGGAGQNPLWDFSIRGDMAPQVLGASSGNGDYIAINWNATTQVTTYSYALQWEEGLT